MKIKPGVFYLIELDEIVEFVEYFDRRFYAFILVDGVGSISKGSNFESKAIYLGEL